MRNECFTKHPLRNGRLVHQALRYVHDIDVDDEGFEDVDEVNLKCYCLQRKNEDPLAIPTTKHKWLLQMKSSDS